MTAKKIKESKKKSIFSSFSHTRSGYVFFLSIFDVLLFSIPVSQANMRGQYEPAEAGTAR